MYKQYETRKGSRVVITSYEGKHYSSRLYVNCGKTATLTCAKHKTFKGRNAWTNTVLNK